MKASLLFPKTIKEAPKDADSINHKLLVRAGFIDQLMTGSWTLLPLGFRVVNKINNIIREEMNAIGGQEMLMPLLTPRSIWDETGRWDKAKEIMYQFSDSNKKDLGLAFTHEEVMMDLLRKKIITYRDLPVYLYHFSTKFRNEPRARSGILRGREFFMKDLYSAHVSEKDLMEYYETVKQAYSKIFFRLGFDFRVVEASGGVFTENFTHEFQVLSEGGEDTVYYCDQCGWGQNKEIFTGKVGDGCSKCKQGKIVVNKAIEVGNIFPQGKWYAEKMNATFVDEKGTKQPIWFGSYGIGPTRILGAWVEVSHDDKGIIWNQAMTPFDAHLITLGDVTNGEEIYHQLEKEGFDILWDERDLTAGQKFADADLLGMPTRLVLSPKTGKEIEWKSRIGAKADLLSISETINRLRDLKKVG